MDGQPSIEGDPLAPSTLMRDLGILVVLAIVVSALVYAVGEWVDGHSGLGVTGFDTPVLEYFEDLRTSSLTSVMQGATDMGGTAAVIILMLGAAIASFLVSRNPRWPIFFVAALLGLELSSAVKPLVDRARPTLSPLYEHIPTAAWPSGHATAAAVCYGSIAYFVASRLSRPWSVLVWIVGIAAALLVGITRVYLGVHWPSDVLAGWFLAGAWVAACAMLIRPREAERVAGVGGYPAG